MRLGQDCSQRWPAVSNFLANVSLANVAALSVGWLVDITVLPKGTGESTKNASHIDRHSAIVQPLLPNQ